MCILVSIHTCNTYLLCITENLGNMIPKLIDLNSRTLKKFGGQWMGREDRHAFDGDKFICLDFIRHKNPSCIQSILSLETRIDNFLFSFFEGWHIFLRYAYYICLVIIKMMKRRDALKEKKRHHIPPCMPTDSFKTNNL